MRASLREFFRFDWKSQRWNLVVALGVAIGGFIARTFLTEDEGVAIGDQTVEKLETLGFESAGEAYLPTELYDAVALGDPKTWILLIIAGVLVGFGTRYAGGCTSGHAISGLSNLQLPSLIAVIGFFAGGLLMIHVLFPLIF